MKDFNTLAILSVTTGRLLTKPKDKSEGNGIGQMYELLGYMTDDSPFTHQLGRFAEECKPWLLRQHPGLESVTSEVESECDAGRVPEIQAEMIRRFGETLPVSKIPRNDHEVKNPYDELVEMRGTDEGIILMDESGNVST